MRLTLGCIPSKSAPPPPNGSKYSFGFDGNTCQMYGISFSLLPIQGINGLAIPATPVRGFGEGFHCLLQPADRRIQTGTHFLELPDGGIQLGGIAGVEVSLTAAGNGDGLAPQAVDLLPQVAFAEVLLPHKVTAANEMLAPKAEAFQIVAQFFIVHKSPFRAAFPEKGAKKEGRLSPPQFLCCHSFPYKGHVPLHQFQYLPVVWGILVTHATALHDLHAF